MNSADMQVLVDHRAISNLLIDYCRLLDRMDLPGLAALFTQDCRVEYGPDERLNSQGAAALEASLQRMWRWARTSHHLSNVRIIFDDADHARANSYVHAWHERPDGSSATILGQYDDRLVRLANGWRISRRRMVMNGCDAGFRVAIHPFERIPPPPGWVAPNID
jgi:3-phenylpropionate/cinnamic acid dioxygenase small subunit